MGESIRGVIATRFAQIGQRQEVVHPQNLCLQVAGVFGRDRDGHGDTGADDNAQLL